MYWQLPQAKLFPLWKGTIARSTFAHGPHAPPNFRLLRILSPEFEANLTSSSLGECSRLQQGQRQASEAAPNIPGAATGEGLVDASEGQGRGR
jgi:hypothetical protein